MTQMNDQQKENCIFCNIALGNSPANILYQDELVTAFVDLHPIAPVHILIIPNRHIESANHAQPDDENVIGHMVTVAQSLAKENGVSESGYRLVINTGPNAGQSVFHLHLHLIGGRHLPFRFE